MYTKKCAVMAWRFYLLTTEGGTPLYLRLDARGKKQGCD
jgi:hypothetical protein